MCMLCVHILQWLWPVSDLHACLILQLLVSHAGTSFHAYQRNASESRMIASSNGGHFSGVQI